MGYKPRSPIIEAQIEFVKLRFLLLKKLASTPVFKTEGTFFVVTYVRCKDTCWRLDRASLHLTFEPILSRCFHVFTSSEFKTSELGFEIRKCLTITFGLLPSIGRSQIFTLLSIFFRGQ